MRKPEIRPLTVAVRVFPYASDEGKDRRSTRSSLLPKGMLVIHTAGSSGSTQKLTIGIYRFIVGGQCLEEGLFYADDLPRRELQVLKDYVVRHNVDAAPGDDRRLRLLTRSEFLDLFYQLAYKARCLVVGFDLSYDISRLAFDCSPARGFYAGGFSFSLWSYKDSRGRERPDGFRPRVCIKHIDSKRSLIGFTGRNSPDQVDLIPEGSLSGKPQTGYKFRGHFLDLRTLAFALTDEGYSLEAACEAFGVEHRKQQPVRHRAITKESIDDNRRDVLAMSELAAKLVGEFAEHPISGLAYARIVSSFNRKGLPEIDGYQAHSQAAAELSEGIPRVRANRVLWRTNECPYSQSCLPGRVHGFYVHVFHRQYPDGSVAVRYCR